MSDTVIALLITVAIIALFFAWVPILEFICPPCGRFLQRRNQSQVGEKRPSVVAIRR